MLVSEYFERIGRSVFEECLKALGARYVSQSNPTVVRFVAADWFVELLVLLEDGPRYCPRVTAGPIPELGVLFRERQIDILHLVPQDSELRRYNIAWAFQNDVEMRIAYERVRDQIFLPFAVPYFLQPDRLREVVVEKCKQLEDEWHDEIATHNEQVHRSMADEAYREKRYSDYLNSIKNVPHDRLSPIDLKKIDYSSKQIIGVQKRG